MSAKDYAREAALIAALQLADSAGFDLAQQSCVDIIADLLLRYVHEVGAGSHHYAELAGRSDTNPVDVVRGVAGGGREGWQSCKGAARSTLLLRHAVAPPRRRLLLPFTAGSFPHATPACRRWR